MGFQCIHLDYTIKSKLAVYDTLIYTVTERTVNRVTLS